MKRSLLVLTLGLLIAGHAPGAWACSCAPWSSDDEAVDAADGVFIAKVVAMEDPEGGGEIVSSGRDIVWTFEVISVEKGAFGGRIDVTSAADGASCGYSFEVGDTYRVFVSKHDGGWNTHLCWPNERVEATATDPGGEPSPRGQTPDEPGDDAPPPGDDTTEPSPPPLGIDVTSLGDGDDGQSATVWLVVGVGAAGIVAMGGLALLARRFR